MPSPPPGGGPIGALGVVLLTASLCMLGHPQFVFLTTAIEVFVLFCAWLSSRNAVDSAGHVALARIGTWFGAKLLGFASAGPGPKPTMLTNSYAFRCNPPVLNGRLIDAAEGNFG